MAIEAVVFDVDGVLVRAGVFGEILDREYGLDYARTSAFFRGPFKGCVIGRSDLREAIEPYLREWGWPGSFDGAFFSCRVGTSKPSRAFFDHVVEQVRIAPDALLLIDDHEANVEGARAAGWNAALHTFGDDLRETLAGHGLSP